MCIFQLYKKLVLSVYKFRSPLWMSCNKYLLVVLIFIFLIANVELLVMRILDLCVSSFVKYLYKTCTHF